MSKWDDRIENNRLVNQSFGIDMREARRRRLALKIHHIDMAEAVGIDKGKFADKEHEVIQTSQGEFVRIVEYLNEKVREVLNANSKN